MIVASAYPLMQEGKSVMHVSGKGILVEQPEQQVSRADNAELRGSYKPSALDGKTILKVRLTIL